MELCALGWERVSSWCAIENSYSQEVEHIPGFQIFKLWRRRCYDILFMHAIVNIFVFTTSVHKNTHLNKKSPSLIKKVCHSSKKTFQGARFLLVKISSEVLLKFRCSGPFISDVTKKIPCFGLFVSRVGWTRSLLYSCFRGKLSQITQFPRLGRGIEKMVN